MKLLNIKSIQFLKKENQLLSPGDLPSAQQLGCPSVPLEVRVDERVSGSLWEDGPLPATDGLAK